MAENNAFKLKMSIQAIQETDRQLEKAKSLNTILEEIIKTAKGRQDLIQVLPKLGGSDLIKKTEDFLIKVHTKEMEVLNELRDIEYGTSDNMNLNVKFIENIKNM
jgi:hypothetical protein